MFSLWAFIIYFLYFYFIYKTKSQAENVILLCPSPLPVGDARKFLKCSTLTQVLLYSYSSLCIHVNIIMSTRYFKFQVCLSASSSNQLVFQRLLSASLKIEVYNLPCFQCFEKILAWLKISEINNIAYSNHWKKLWLVYCTDQGNPLFLHSVFMQSLSDQSVLSRIKISTNRNICFYLWIILMLKLVCIIRNKMPIILKMWMFMHIFVVRYTGKAKACPLLMSFSVLF